MALCTVTGKLVNPDGSALSGASIVFTLQAPGKDIPKQPGADDVMPFTTPTATSAADGTFSIQLIGNDQIQPAGSTYLATFKSGNSSLQVTYSITGSNFDLTSAVPVGSTGYVSPYTPANVLLAAQPSTPGNFSIAHGLGRVPNGAFVMMTSGGQIWFQSPLMFDGNDVYLVASDAGVSAKIFVW